MISARLASIFIVIVTVVWVSSFIASLVLPTYKPDPQINLIFTTIATSLMTIRARKSEDKKSVESTGDRPKET